MKPIIKSTLENINNSPKLNYEKSSNSILNSIFNFFDNKSGLTEYNNNTLSYEKNNGDVYIVNRQPTIKEIWISSPVSGSNKFKMSRLENDNIGKYKFLDRKGNEIIEFLRSEIK